MHCTELYIVIIVVKILEIFKYTINNYDIIFLMLNQYNNMFCF